MANDAMIPAPLTLDPFDRIWDRNRLAEKYKTRLVRYADDMVMLCARERARPYAILQSILTKLDLKLNEDKTQIRNVREERFEFLGFSIGVVKAKQSGKHFPLVEPSDKAIQSIKQKIKFYTRRDMNPVPIGCHCRQAQSNSPRLEQLLPLWPWSLQDEAG